MRGETRFSHFSINLLSQSTLKLDIFPISDGRVPLREFSSGTLNITNPAAISIKRNRTNESANQI